MPQIDLEFGDEPRHFYSGFSIACCSLYPAATHVNSNSGAITKVLSQTYLMSL